MTVSEAVVGQRVRSLVDFSGIPKGTDGVIDEDYGRGVMIAWDYPKGVLPAGYHEYDQKPAVQTRIVRDGFNKTDELQWLEVIA